VEVYSTEIAAFKALTRASRGASAARQYADLAGALAQRLIERCDMGLALCQLPIEGRNLILTPGERLPQFADGGTGALTNTGARSRRDILCS
jgi:hypothetical protein